MIGRDACIRRFTPEAGRLLRLISTDIGRPISDLSPHFAAFNLDIDLAREVMNVVETEHATEIEVQNRKGHWYRLQVKPYRATGNRIEGAVVTLIDIDVLKQSMVEIENARLSAEAGNRAKDLFLATLSHELRTPLTTILSFAQMLRMNRLQGPQLKRAVDMIEQSALTQAQLINDLLDVSRIIMGKLSLDIKEIDPVSVLEATIDGIRPAAEGKSITIHAELPSLRHIAEGDPVRLKQVFWNILTNAVKFSEKGSSIEITVSYDVNTNGNYISIRFEDHGQGISKEFLPHLFDRFTQADSSSTRLHGGMGLGLAIVRDLIERQKGSVTAQSEGEGKGSTFTVTLPISHVQLEKFEHVPPHHIDADKLNRLQGLKVLLVEDDQSAAESISTLLQAFGAEVSVAYNVNDGLNLFEVLHPDILISDVAMPHEDGYSLIQKVRTLPASVGGKVAAVALTAYASIDDERKAVKAGFHTHLCKPVDAMVLVDEITRLTKR